MGDESNGVGEVVVTKENDDDDGDDEGLKGERICDQWRGVGGSA